MPRSKFALPPPIPPPEGLGKEALALWDLFDAEYRLTEASATVLRARLSVLDALEKQLDAEGRIVLDRFEQRRPHPAVKVARDARRDLLEFARTLQRKGSMLGL